MFTLLYSVLNIVRDNDLNAITLIKWFVFGQSSTPLYYIVVLFYFSIFTPLLYKYVNSKKRIIFYILPILLIMIFYILEYKNFNLWSWVKYSPIWFIFYWFGMVVKNKKYQGFGNIKTSVVIVLVAFLLEIFETLILCKVENMNAIAYSQMKITGILYSLSIINLLIIISRNINVNNDNFFVWLGNESYGVYFVHMFFLLVINKILSFTSIGFLPLYRIIQLVFALSMSMVSIVIIKKVLGEKVSKLLFGF